MYREKRNNEELNSNDLAMINGGVAPVVIAVGVIATPFVLGAIAGGAVSTQGREDITEHD